MLHINHAQEPHVNQDLFISHTVSQRELSKFHLKITACESHRDFINTCLLIHKQVKISVDEWILETTCPHKHVIILTTSEYFLSIFLFRARLEAKILFLRLFELLFSHFLVQIIFKTLVEQLKIL